MSTNGTAERQRLLDTLHDVWKNDPRVRLFALSFDPGAISHEFGAWQVPVLPNAPTGTARDLIQAVGDIEDAVERRAQLPVTLLIDLSND
jgi:hypothetical protein